MKKTKIVGIVCLMLVVLCCLTACGDDGYNASKAKSVTITATLTHEDGVLLQKIESVFTKNGKAYNYTQKNTALNTLDGTQTGMYATEETSGESKSFFVPTFREQDFAAIYEMTDTKIYAKLSIEKIYSLGIHNASGDVTVTLELDGNQLISMTIDYTNSKNAVVQIVAKMAY